MTNLLIAVLVFFVLVSGPLVIFTLIKLVSRSLGGLRATMVRLDNAETPLGLKIEWDSESYPHEVYRVRVDFYELVRGGRSTSFSYTFEGRSFKRKNFVIPLVLSDEQKQMLLDDGVDGSKRALDNSQLQIEIETTSNQTERYKIKKAQIRKVAQSGKFVEKSSALDI